MKIPNYLATDGADVRAASANFTLTAQDNGRTIVVSGSRTVTIPIGLHKGFFVSFVALDGVVTLSPASGVTYQGNRSIGTGASGTLIAVAGNSYVSDVPSGSGVKVYRALLTQAGGAAPTAVVLENSLGGTVVWTYVNTGEYAGTLVGAFTENKTLCFLTNGNPAWGGGGYGTVSVRRSSADVVTVLTTDGLNAPADTKLENASLTILVYP